MSATILVVDDDVDLRECLGECLTTIGYNVRLAASGQDAMRLLQAEPQIDLILSDHIMNDGDGLFLLEYVRRLDPKNPPFFLITGQSQVLADRVLELGAQEFISKPFDFPSLIGKVKKYLPDR